VKESKYVFIGIAILLTYLFGLPLDVMETYAAQYASISMEMYQTGNYLEVPHRGGNYYLDKPPLLFWLSALSFNLFGISNAAYKIPSLLFVLLGIYCVYQFGNQFYNNNVGKLAALIFATFQGVFFFVNDVRTDAILTGSICLAVWQLALFCKRNTWLSLFLGFTGVGLAMLAKGPIGAAIPAMAIVGDCILRRNFANLLNWKWLIGIVWVAIMLIPMTIGLYNQHGIKGLEFYFWTQSFGRITGQSNWQNDTSIFFLAHNFLWVALPWTFFVLYSIYFIIKYLWKNKGIISPNEEGFSFAGFLLPFIVLSLSKYQLPHYIYVVLPFAAIFTAHFIDNLKANTLLMKYIQIFQYILLTFLFLAIFLALTIPFGIANIITILFTITLLAIVF